MALPVLDGNQSATTLSSVVTGGEHIVAHSVVCFGSTAISNITNAVSGSVVSISNFPSTQTVAGTVTANVQSFPIIFSGANVGTLGAGNFITDSGGPANDLGIGIAYNTDITDPSIAAVVSETAPLPVQVLGGSVTIGSLPAISGTVTANVADLISQGTDGEGSPYRKGVQLIGLNWDNDGNRPVQTDNVGQLRVVAGSDSQNFPISGTVTANASLQNSNSVAQAFIDESNSYGSLSVVLSGSAANIGVVGTVTAAAPNGSLTTRFGTPTTANVSFATAAVTKSDRKYLLIQNVTTGSNVITVGIGFTPTTTQGIQLTAGAGITFESSYIPTGAVYVLSSVTASNFTILEA